jgi:methionyl-tRNA synthetase
MTKHLITSALPYINGIKHLGNLAGSMLPADVYARYLRQSGREVLFICATDDHGAPAELAAAEAGIDTATFCDRQHRLQKEVYERFALSFDHFGRTSRPQNAELTQHFAAKLVENGFAEVRSMRQIYSLADKRFLPDRYVVGTCPHCGYENARGDQCENCTRVLDPADLLQPRSSISGSPDLEFRDTNHLFLRQSLLASEIRSWVDGQSEWPLLVSSIAYKWLNEGLLDRSITRDLRWGVPVTQPGLEGKVYYVWFDAPIGYIAATKEWSDADPTSRNWRSYWYDTGADVRYVQFMAKDNIPFHTVSFPATILGSREPWKQVDYLKGFNWLNYYGGKFSTSQKRGVFLDQALEILPPDYWRYYLMARSPESDDSSFTWEDLQTVANKDLSNVLGNFVNRILSFSANRFGPVVPAAATWTEVEDRYCAAIKNACASYSAELEHMNFRKATDALRGLWVLGNEYAAEAAPWTAIKTDSIRAETISNFAINLIGVIAIASSPIIPETAGRIAEAVGADLTGWLDDIESLMRQRKGGEPLNTPGLLFARIEDERVTELRQRFAGHESASPK